MTGAFSFLEADDAELGSAFALLNRHHAVVFDLRLKMPIGRWFLPQSVNFGLASFFDHLGKARRLYFEKFHARKSPPENYGKEDQTTVAAFLPWRGSLVLSP